MKKAILRLHYLLTLDLKKLRRFIGRILQSFAQFFLLVLIYADFTKIQIGQIATLMHTHMHLHSSGDTRQKKLHPK